MITNHRRKQKRILFGFRFGWRKSNYVCPDCKFTAKSNFSRKCPHCSIEMQNKGDIRRASKKGRKPHGHTIIPDSNETYHEYRRKKICKDTIL